MGRLIDENDLMRLLDEEDRGGYVDMPTYMLRDEIYAIPSAHPEIIHCEDCKHMIEHYDTDGNVPYWVCSEWDSGTDYDGFCHYAERRTDENNMQYK